MTSFISSFKPLLIALMVVAIVEVTFRAWVDVPQKYNSDMLTLAPQQKERITSVFLNEKINALSRLPAKFVQVGDSSGFYGIQPNLIHSKDGWTNYSCCARTGFSGYRVYASEILKRQREAGNHPEYLVLALTPYYAPLSEYESSELSEVLRAEFAEWWRFKSWLGGWRLLFTNVLYRATAENRLLDSRVDSYWGNSYSALAGDLAKLPQTAGWIERPGAVIPLPLGACEFVIEKDEQNEELTLFRRELDSMASFAEASGVKLIVLANPVACMPSEDSVTLQAELDAFSKAHPRVIIPFKIHRQYPPRLFKDQWHLNVAGSARNSREIAQALKAILY